MRRWSQSIVLGFALVLAFAPTLARAHPQVLTTEPAADARLSSPPAQLRVQFNEPIEAAFAELTLRDIFGQPVDALLGTRDASDPTVLSRPAPALVPGIYTAVWRVVGSDGHLTSGSFSFTIIGATATPPPGIIATPAAPAAIVRAPVTNAATPGSLLTIARALLLLATLGAAAGPLIMLTMLRTADDAPLRLRVGALTRWCALGLLVGLGAVLLLHMHTLAARLDIQTLRDFATGTRSGILLLVRGALALLLLAALQFNVAWSTAPLALALLVCAGLGGHASSAAEPASAALLAAVHLEAAALWIGGLLQLVCALLPGLARPPAAAQPAAVARILGRFSWLALISVVVLAISGTATALRQFTAAHELWTTSYGQTLLIKLGLFLILLGFGAYHRRTIQRGFAALGTTPQLHTWLTRMRQSTRAELAFASILLLVVALLSSLPPPAMLAAAPPRTPVAPLPTRVTAAVPTQTAMPSVAFDATQTSGDLQIGLALPPAHVGWNTATVMLRTTRGAPLDIQRVQLVISMTDMEMGSRTVIAQPIGVGSYRAEKLWFSMVGTWQITVQVRRSAATDAETTFRVPVGE